MLIMRGPTPVLAAKSSRISIAVLCRVRAGLRRGGTVKSACAVNSQKITLKASEYSLNLVSFFLQSGTCKPYGLKETRFCHPQQYGEP